MICVAACFVVTGRPAHGRVVCCADDPEVVAVACASAALALKFASKRLRKDASFVLSLIQQKAKVLAHAESEVQSDKEVVKAACALEVLSTAPNAHPVAAPLHVAATPA